MDQSIFESDAYVPLAERMRPRSIDDIIGQDTLLAKKTASRASGRLRMYVEQGNFPSMILWGKPGTGKTSIARIIAKQIANSFFVDISAVNSGVAELKKLCLSAQERRQNGITTFLFIDEIHRFNKSQQDALLHYVEDATVVLIGATTENPSFEINNALLSRVQILILEDLSKDNLLTILKNAERVLSHEFAIDELALEALLGHASGDARRLLNLVEQFYVFQKNTGQKITTKILKDINVYVPAQHDKDGDAHYSLISALHKSIRGSDCDAALYWFSRMLEGGEDPRYIARRLLRCAYEDIGLADMQVSEYVLHAWESYERLGSPEGEIAIASAVLLLALSPKSNSVYKAYAKARDDASSSHNLAPPMHIVNAPNAFMKKLGYGKDYQYDHDTKNAFSGQNYFPDNKPRVSYYEPEERGFEREMKKRVEYFDKLRRDIHNNTHEQYRKS